MPRNISFSLTTQQVRDKTKTVTRRMGWWNLKEGEILNACVKCMGLKPGEKIEVICQIRVISTRREKLNRMMEDLNYGFDEVKKEGFGEGEINRPSAFIHFFCASHKGCTPDSAVNRIEFSYL